MLVLDGRIRLRRGAGALNPLPLKVPGNLRADEVAVAGVLNLDLRPRDGGLWVEKSHPLLVPGPRRAALDAGRHELFPVFIQMRKRIQSRDSLISKDIPVLIFQIASNFKHRITSRRHNSKTEKERSTP